MQKFAVFDIDGTLIRWQLYHTIVNKLAKEGQLGNSAAAELKQARMRWKRREPDYSFHEYEWRLIEIYEKAVPHIPTETFDALITPIVEEYKDQTYTYTRDLALKLKADGYTLLAISGSHEELVAEIARYFGFDDWIGTQYQRTETGSFTGERYVGSHDKEAALHKLIKKHHLTLEDSYAVGDSKSDAPMLEMVERPIAFNPDRALYDIATKAGWDIVVERKNVVYTLRKQDNTYQLY